MLQNYVSSPCFFGKLSQFDALCIFQAFIVAISYDCITKLNFSVAMTFKSFSKLWRKLTVSLLATVVGRQTLSAALDRLALLMGGEQKVADRLCAP